MKIPTPYLVIVYRGGCRPRAYACAVRDAANGLVGASGKIDKGAIWEQRARYATHFLEQSPQQWMLFVDGDLEWREDMIPTLGSIVMETRGVVGCVVSKDSFGAGCATSPPMGRHEGIGDGSRRYVDVEHGIGAPMAIHRDALAKIVEAAPFFNAPSDLEELTLDRVEIDKTGERYWTFFQPYNRAWMPTRYEGKEPLMQHRHDDTAFCDRALAAGARISVALGPRVLHYGEFGFSPETSVREDLVGL
ncbi:MAG: hypothetical protein KC503_17315 [Myxococcales bacterium]|nr:hypothetical protein [Myxococcales bacterium]